MKTSVNNYHRMIETGILGDRHVELLASEIVEMTPETPIHYNTAKRGTKYLEELLKGKAEVRFNGPITLATSEPEPDITIVSLPESKYNYRHPYPEDIYWLIEVAQTSLKKDLEIKSAIYATANITEYWILNLVNQNIIILRETQNGKYTLEQTISTGIITPLAFPDIQISVERLLS